MQDFRPDLLGKLLHGLAGAKYLLRYLPRLRGSAVFQKYLQVVVWERDCRTALLV
jgi:hypothetical protein